MKRSRQDKTVAEKLVLLDLYKSLPPLSQRDAAGCLGVSRGFLQNLLKNEATIRAEDPELGTVKRKRVGKDEDVENALFSWFKFARLRNPLVNGPTLMHKANNIAQAAGHTEFKATGGWLSRWKKRYGLTFSALKDGSSGTNIGRTEEHGSMTIEEIFNTYSPDNIYNAHETALVFRALPESMYEQIAKNTTQEGFKTAKDCVTLLVTCNINGDKEDLLLIGKSKSPSCFKNMKILPISYEYSTNAWMTAAIFEKWLVSWDRRLQKQGRKVALLVENCSAHNSIASLKNITLHFLQPDTSLLQPCSMGVIRALKAYYRHEMCLKIIDIIDDSENELVAETVVKHINLMEAMHMIKRAWTKVSSVTIQNCWKKGTISTKEPIEGGVIQLSPLLVGIDEEQFEAWVTIDDDVKAVQHITEEQFTEELVSKIRDKEQNVDQNSDDAELDETTPSAAEMRKCLHRLALGLDRTAFKDTDLFNAVKSEINDHLRQTFPPKPTTLLRFYSSMHDT